MEAFVGLKGREGCDVGGFRNGGLRVGGLGPMCDGVCCGLDVLRWGAGKACRGSLMGRVVGVGE